MSYTPINCNLYDRLLAASTLRQSVNLTWQSSPNEPIIICLQIIIEDVYTTSDSEEYLRISDGQMIRLDYILSMEVRKG